MPLTVVKAANAGTGPEGHKRSASVDFGASSDATIVVASIDGINGAIDGSHKSVATGKPRTSPPEPSHERAASDPELAAHDAKRGRVSTDTASGAPALATHTTTAGSPTAAAPITVSIDTATALAVADPYVSVLDEPNEAPDGGHDEGAPAHSAPAAAARDAAAPAASSAEPEAVIAAGTPAPASGGIGGRSALHDRNPAPASASAITGAASALGAAASKSATIDANPASRGNAGCPETSVISRRSHAVAGAVSIRDFDIGRTSTPAPAALAAGGSKSAVIVANATSRVRAHCPSTPVVSRLAVPRAAGRQYRAFCIGRKSCTLSAAAATAVPLANATTPAGPPAPPPLPVTALGFFGLTGSRVPSHSPPTRVGSLCAVFQAIQRGVHAIQNALPSQHPAGQRAPLDVAGVAQQQGQLRARGEGQHAVG